MKVNELRKLKIIRVDWPTKGSFRIARSALTHIPTLRVEIEEDGVIGRAECRPYTRYNESCETVREQIEALRPALIAGLLKSELQNFLKPGAARNAIDCALWDLEAKLTGISVSERLGLEPPRPRETAFTLSIDTPSNMAQAAQEAARYTLLKIKIKADSGAACAKAILQARPDARLIIDANEALSFEQAKDLLLDLKGLNIVLIEQPMPQGQDQRLPHLPKGSRGETTPMFCADESLHTEADLDPLWEAGYRSINVKLDKCGGLTAGLSLMQTAKDKGFQIMAGCMVGSSLAMAPMIMLERFADVIDLDGPLLLSKDIENGLKYDGAIVHPPSRALWGA